MEAGGAIRPRVNMEEHRSWSRSDAVAWRAVGDDMVIVPVASRRDDLDSIYVLNETAAAIWVMLDGRRSERELAEEMALRFEVDAAVARADLSEILGQLAEIGAVTGG